MYVLLHYPSLGSETRRLVRLSFIVILFAAKRHTVKICSIFHIITYVMCCDRYVFTQSEVDFVRLSCSPMIKVVARQYSVSS